MNGYIDNKDAIDLLLEAGRITEPHPQMLEEIPLRVQPQR